MSEIFLQSDICDLLNNRFIVIIGDSIQRAVYKDFVMLLQKNKYLTDRDLRAKGETSFIGDKLIEGGQLGEMTNGVKYREVRQYQTDYHLVRFYFVTRCYNGYVESILSDLSQDPVPDVFIMNSCLWDISRYGSSSVTQYKKNLDTLFKRLNEVLPESCLVIWNMTLPISKRARGGVLIPEVEHLNVSLRLDILEANFYVHKLALQYGYNTLDLHFFLRHQLQRRAGDGVHWDMTAHRRITNLILTHISEAWSKKSPNHARNVLLDEHTNMNVNPMISRPGEQLFTNNIHSGLGIPTGQFGLLDNLQHGQFFEAETDRILKRQAQVLSRVNNNNLYQNNRNSDWGNQQEMGNYFQGKNQGFIGSNVGKRSSLLDTPNNNFVREYYYEQQRNIDRYGGPICRSNFNGVDLSQMQLPDLQAKVINALGPYRNDEFVTNVRGRRSIQEEPYNVYSRNIHNR